MRRESFICLACSVSRPGCQEKVADAIPNAYTLAHAACRISSMKTRKSNFFRLCLIAGSLLLFSLAANAQAKKAAPLKLPDPQNTVRAIVQSGKLDDLRWPNFTDYRIHL